MEKINFTVPCLFGLEGIVGNELRRLNVSDVAPENGRVHFCGTMEDLVRANLWVRSGERVLVRLGTFRADTFDALFEGTKALPWERWIPKDGAFPVKGHSLQSKLFSIPDCQKIVKKAIVERLKATYHVNWLEETGSKYTVQFSIMKDEAVLYLDTSGAGLHKRGYRANANEAPLRETLAAAMVTLSKYRGREYFCDPFCGSGTILIEAAMIAQNRAPGLYRNFAAESWACVPQQMWDQARAEAKEKIFRRDFTLWGGDVDDRALSTARSNARKAGVAQYIRFEHADAKMFHPEQESGIIVCNPPYGERMLDLKQTEQLYREFGATMKQNPGYQLYLISSHAEFERFYGKRAAKRRKLYNGMIKCEFYQYY
ncbi:MAG: class I SAM-dependent RNA methyltransferase [Oscillospiraceae bacterium]|nr:class I SAM-dependent RNA methyltransferase [Oscillospiraceae bacterium]